MGGSKKEKVEETETEKALARRSAAMWQSYYELYAPAERALVREVDRAGSAQERERMAAATGVDNLSMSAVGGMADLSAPAKALLAHQLGLGVLADESGRVGVAQMEKAGRAYVESIAMGRDIEQTAHQMLGRNAGFAHRAQVSRAQAKQLERDALVGALGQAAGFAGELYASGQRAKEIENVRKKTRESLGYPEGGWLNQ